MEAPSLGDLRSDMVRLQDACRQAGRVNLRAGLPVLADLSDRLRQMNWRFRLVLAEDEIVAVLPYGQTLYGLAVDIGTTKVAAYLVNLEDGQTVAMTGAMNPQVAYGEDVVSRIAYVNESPDHKTAMQQTLIDTLNVMTARLCEEGGVSREQIVDAVVVGNTAIHHLFLGLPVLQLGMSPFISAVSQAIQVSAVELGLKMAPGAMVYLPPNIAGYVGADHVSVLLASSLLDEKRTVIACDIGTNTEISITHQVRFGAVPALPARHLRAHTSAPGCVQPLVRLNGSRFWMARCASIPLRISRRWAFAVRAFWMPSLKCFRPEC